MDYYYIRGAGSTNWFNKTNMLRKAKKAAVWYFQDRFGLTINLVGLIMMVI